MTLASRFAKFVDRRGDDECWEWCGYRNPSGYGRFRLNGKTEQAHRVALWLAGTHIPPGLEVDHLCRNRGCVNPKHLDVVTKKENVLRGESFSAKHARKTHCNKGHELTDWNLITTTDRVGRTGRRCRQCLYESNRRVYAKLRRSQ